MTKQEAEWMRRQDYEASAQVKIAAIKRLRAIGFYTAEQHDAELAKVIGRIEFKSAGAVRNMCARHGIVDCKRC